MSTANINTNQLIADYYASGTILLLSILYLSKLQLKISPILRRSIFSLIILLYFIAAKNNQYITITILVIFILVLHFTDPQKLEEMFSTGTQKQY